MKMTGYVLLALLVTGAFFFWLRLTTPLPSLHVPTIPELVQEAPAQTASVANAVTNDDPVDLVGTITADTTGGAYVPYLEYVTANHGVATKQLVYADVRACAAAAGDLPCVNLNQNAAYPQYPAGTNVRVRGLHVDDRILVYEIDVISGT